jgi:hypothetical protein
MCSRSAADMHKARCPHVADSPMSTPNVGSWEGRGSLACNRSYKLPAGAEPHHPSGELAGDLRWCGRSRSSCPTAQVSGERRAPFCANAVHRRRDLVQERIAIRRRCHVRNRRCSVVDLVPNDRCAREARSAARLIKSGLPIRHAVRSDAPGRRRLSVRPVPTEAGSAGTRTSGPEAAYEDDHRYRSWPAIWLLPDVRWYGTFGDCRSGNGFSPEKLAAASVSRFEWELV